MGGHYNSSVGLLAAILVVILGVGCVAMLLFGGNSLPLP